ncbi:MAG TPA: ArsB/NhaD family transporter, partial [Candidatus Binataceae bacterium]|nr:ArsB/NhaD family transporter [Candidatus Binataceae bacterium]
IVRTVGAERLGNPVVLAIVMTALGNLVSNVPAVMLFRPLYPALAGTTNSGLVIAGASTLAGNLTVLGSIANLIVIEEAHRQHVEISFGEYLRVGLPVTIATIAIAVATLSVGY